MEDAAPGCRDWQQKGCDSQALKRRKNGLLQQAHGAQLSLRTAHDSVLLFVVYSGSCSLAQAMYVAQADPSQTDPSCLIF